MWRWIESQVGGSSGDAAVRAFKNTELSPAERLAREAIQNSWDATQESLYMDSGHRFRVTFRFTALTGEHKSGLVEALQLDELARRSELMDQSHMKLMSKTCLGALDDPTAPLRILEISDRGAHGLYGHPDLKRKSHLYKALFTLGETGKGGDGTSGGSFGFGKSAFIGTSRISTVAAYTCFARRTEAPYASDPATRRFVAMAWWPSHEIGPDDFNGTAWLGATCGNSNAQTPSPAEDAEADEVARSIHVAVRDPQEQFDHGTSLVIVDPSVNPADLLEGIERNWWPALISRPAFDAEVIDYEGNYHAPDPESSHQLKPFIRAFKIAANGDARVDSRNESRTNLNPVSIGGIDVHTGVLAQKAPGPNELGAGLSIDDAADRLLDADYPIIAFIREPRMVVKYHVFNKLRVKLPLRGVLLADQSFDSLLKRMEPPLHNEWTTDPDSHDDEDIAAARVEFRNSVLRQVRDEIRAFAIKAQPAAPPTNTALPEFQKLIGNLIGKTPGKQPPPPPGNPLPIQISTSEQQEAITPTAIRLAGEYKFTDDRDKTDGDWLTIILEVKLRALGEDDRAGEIIPTTLSVTQQDAGSDFRQAQDGSFVGKTRPGSTVAINLLSAPYDYRWEVRSEVSARPAPHQRPAKDVR